jgi:HEAT repeat protein
LKTVLNGIQALGERGHRPAAEVLLRLLETTDTMTVKRNVVLSLGRMRAEKALPKVIEQFSIPVESLQLAVLESLSLYRNYESLFALYEFMRSQENVSFQVRMNATYLMTRLVGKRMIPLLKEALNEEDFRIKANALESIALLKEREMIPLVLPYLQHTSRRLRANAAICLYPFRPQRNETRKTIDALFRSEDPLTRFSGIYAIGELELTEYRRPLIELLENPDLRYRQNVITALAKMRIPGYPEEFVQMLLDPDDEVALGSVRRLGRFSKYSRWRIFEIVSHRPAFERRKIIQRLEQTPLDFSEEKELLETHLSPPPSHPL